MRRNESSTILTIGLVAVLIVGCASEIAPSYFKGELYPINDPITIDFDPAGSYAFEIQQESMQELSFPELESFYQERSLEWERGVGVTSLAGPKIEPATKESLIEGSAIITREGSKYLHEVTVHSYSVDLTGGKKGSVSYQWSDPALFITFKTDKTDGPFDEELDPASKLIVDAKLAEELGIDLSKIHKSLNLIGPILSQRTIEEGDKILIPIEEIGLNAIKEPGGEPDTTGDVVWVVRGTTMIHGRRHVVADFSGGWSDPSDKEYESTTTYSGYSVIDLSTGIESAWERFVRISIESNQVALTHTQKVSGKSKITAALPNDD